MSVNSQFTKLVQEYQQALQKSQSERVGRLDLVFKEGALNAVEQARKMFDIELDFSEESLKYVEFIMDELHNTVKRLDSSEKWIDQIVSMYAGYIGYLIQIRWPGEWRAELEYPIKKGPVLKIQDKDFFLTERVRQRLTKGREYNLSDYYRSVLAEMEVFCLINGQEPNKPSEVALPVIAADYRQTDEVAQKLPESMSKLTNHQELELSIPDSDVTIQSSVTPVQAPIELKQQFPEFDWVINVIPLQRGNFFTWIELWNIFNPEWREKAGFASGLVDIYGLPPGEVRWHSLNEKNLPTQLYAELEIRCNLFAIYSGKANLNPRYLEVYYRTIKDIFAHFRFEVAVTPRHSFDEGVARIKTSKILN